MRYIFILLLLLPLASMAQKFTVSGYVTDSSSGESLIGANVFVSEQKVGTATNNYGFFSIQLPEGKHKIQVSFIGFETFQKEISLNEDLNLNVALGFGSSVLNEIELTAERENKNVSSSEMSTVELDVDQVQELPAVFGEVDILKTIQLLPGVQSAGEGNAGFYVRGGGPDQNLILLDEAVVYNASHLLGFFSVFNADAIKNVNLIKGGMPAKYGGRLSSVLDISMRDGNYKKHQVKAGIGLISSRFTAEGPLLKEKSSYIVSGRRTYIDVLLSPFEEKIPDLEGNSYFFYDLNAKLNYRVSDKDRIFLSGYFGRDLFSFRSPDSDFAVSIPWGNATASLRWNHVISPRWFMNSTLVFSDYQFEFNAAQDDFELGLFSGIRDYNWKTDFSWHPNDKHQLNMGWNYTWHVFTPSNVTAKLGNTTINADNVIKYKAHEAAVYIQDDWKITDLLQANVGLRFSSFAQVGPFDRFVYNDRRELQDTVNYEKGEVIKFYSGLEPRLTLRYQIDEQNSIKAAYTRNFQYVHLASISAVSLPTDVWIPSSDRVEPQLGIQYAIGYFRNFLDNTYEASVEFYYKDLENLVEYREGEGPTASPVDNPDNPLVFGTGSSYGMELFFKKRIGKLNGWLGYTLSKTTRTFDEINEGKTFVAKYDRVHDFSITATYKLNKKITFGTVFVYATGNSITLPERRYFVEGDLVVDYGERNSYRMVPYHRLDLSMTLVPKPKSKFQSKWVFAVYNVYNRKNPYFIYFDSDGDIEEGTFKTSAKQVSLFPIIPSVTWNFTF